MTAARIEDPTKMRELMLAGDATFTVVSKATGKRYTYRVVAPRVETARGGLAVDRAAPVRFVKVLTGPDNEGDFTYAGTLRPTMVHWEGFRFAHGGAKAGLADGAASVVGIAWLVAALRVASPKLGQVEFWHEGKCCRCGRKLTDPASISRGLGPECAGLT